MIKCTSLLIALINRYLHEQNHRYIAKIVNLLTYYVTYLLHSTVKVFTYLAKITYSLVASPYNI